MAQVTLTRDDLKLAVKHLKDGRALLSKRNVWIKGAVHRNDWERVCSLGALYKVSGTMEHGYAGNVPAIRFLDCAMGGSGHGTMVATFNDHRSTTRAQLLGKWDDAIALAKTALKKASPKEPTMRKILRARS